MGGLKLAGAVLPVVGIAILLHYLPVGKFVAFFNCWVPACCVSQDTNDGDCFIRTCLRINSF